jgi:hypothetical protein
VATEFDNIEPICLYLNAFLQNSCSCSFGSMMDKWFEIEDWKPQRKTFQDPLEHCQIMGANLAHLLSLLWKSKTLLPRHGHDQNLSFLEWVWTMKLLIPLNHSVQSSQSWRNWYCATTYGPIHKESSSRYGTSLDSVSYLYRPRCLDSSCMLH